ncbi:MAG: flagellar protein FlaG [Lachnospiraceae bacterium]|jgi:flagellar protein FlaG|nr:flagellar protein FlaG [Lachnospiraceae bacterium]
MEVMRMELGSVKNTAATYQGSGLENGVSQKAAVDIKVAEAPAPVPIKTEKVDKGNERNVEGKLEVQEPSRQDSVRRAVEQINRMSKHSEAIFGIHDETNRVTIKIVDKETKEVLKEIPPEETLDMIAKVWELAGLMMDERG